MSIAAQIDQTRRSDRISLALPVQIFGTEITGQDFCETTRTHLLTRGGAAIVLQRQLAPLQELIIRNLASGKEATAQVIGPMGARPEGTIYAVTLLDPPENLWNVNFPPIPEEEIADFRVLLECHACSQRELLYLDNLESEVFEANRKITRPCERCGEPTTWHQAAHDLTPDRNFSRNMPQPDAQYRKEPDAPSRDNRKYPRVRMKMAACVVLPGFCLEEIVTVEDISRGGLSFHAANDYHPGSVIEVAAPYTAGAANVFVTARVVRVENRAGAKLPLYAVAYLKKET